MSLTTSVSLPSTSARADCSISAVNRSVPKDSSDTEAGPCNVGASATGVTVTVKLRTVWAGAPPACSVAVAVRVSMVEPPKLAGAFKARPASCAVVRGADVPELRANAPAPLFKVQPAGTPLTVTLRVSDPSRSSSRAAMADSSGMVLASSSPVTGVTLSTGASATGSTFTSAVTVAPVDDCAPTVEVAMRVRPEGPA